MPGLRLSLCFPATDRVAIERYLLDRVSSLVPPGLPILDLGCGDGRLVRRLNLQFPGRVYGFDLPRLKDRCRMNLVGDPLEAGFDTHFRFEPPGPSLPFPQEEFGMVVSNQVLEHVKDLDAYFHGCSKALHPTGRVLCVFPPSSHLIEAHTRIPFAHWLPPGRLRQKYIGLFGVGSPNRPPRTVLRYEEFWDHWLETNTFYRSVDAVKAVALNHFWRVTDDALAYSQHVLGQRSLSLASMLKWLPYYLLNATLILSKPR